MSKDMIKELFQKIDNLETLRSDREKIKNLKPNEETKGLDASIDRLEKELRLEIK